MHNTMQCNKNIQNILNKKFNILNCIIFSNDQRDSQVEYIITQYEYLILTLYFKRKYLTVKSIVLNHFKTSAEKCCLLYSVSFDFKLYLINYWLILLITLRKIFFFRNYNSKF